MTEAEEAKQAIIQEILRKSSEKKTAESYQEGGDFLDKLEVFKEALMQYHHALKQDPSDVTLIFKIIRVRRKMYDQGLIKEANKILGLEGYIQAHKQAYRFSGRDKSCLE